MSVPDYKINYKSDFVLTINGDAGWATQFCIKFWTGMPSQAYFVGFDGVKYVNCRVGDTPTQLLVMFDDHHLPIGKLKMQIAYHTTIEEFPGSVFDEVTNARDVIVTIDGTDYQVMLDFTGEDAPELEFDLPAYANEAERIQNELQRQQNEADRIAAELQREQATAAAVQGAENVNAQLNGTTLTVTNRQGVSTSVNTKGEQGEQGPVGPEGPQGEQGVSIVDFSPKSQTETALIYTATFSDGHTQDVAIPKGPKGDTGPTGPQGPQGQTGVSITGLIKTGETETDTLYNVTFSNGTTQQVSIPKGEKGDTGAQGNSGYTGAAGELEVVNNLTQGGATAALSAEMGKVLSEDISQLVGDLSGSIETPFALVGNNKTSVQHFFQLTAGHTYKLTTNMKTSDYSNASITNKINVYSLAYTINGSVTNVFVTQKNISTPPAEYIFTAVNADNYYVTIRVNAGVTISFNLIEYVNAELVDGKPVSGSTKLVSSNGLYKILANCYKERGGSQQAETVYISNGDLGNSDQAWNANDKRIALKKNALIDVANANSVSLDVDYDAIGDVNIDRFLIPFYDKDKNYLTALDMGWTMFGGTDKTITVDLTDPIYNNVSYVGIYFGSNNIVISPSSINTAYIVYTLQLSAASWIEAVSVDMIDYRSMATYQGQKVVIENKYDYEVLFNMPSQTQNRQGAAIYGNYLIQGFNTNAYVQVWDLTSKTLTQTIDLMLDANNHAAGLSFGKFYSSSDPFPLLYISAFYSNYIYVYRITGTIGNLSMALIQTITIDSSLMYLPNMVIDRENMKMILYGYNINSYSQAANNYLKFAVLDVPPTDNDLTITQSDMEKQFTLPYRYACQDSVAFYGKMLMFWGYAGNVQGSGFIQVDYANGLLISDADTNAMLDNTDEVQGVGIWNGDLITTSYLGVVRKIEF